MFKLFINEKSNFSFQLKCKFGSKIWIRGCCNIDFGIDGNLSKFIITLGSFVSNVGANLTTPLTFQLVQNVESYKIYVKGQIENPFHIEILYVLMFYSKHKCAF